MKEPKLIKRNRLSKSRKLNEDKFKPTAIIEDTFVITKKDNSSLLNLANRMHDIMKLHGL